jgi:hypothetical protein
VREQTCSSLESHGLNEDFITISIRQGDKKSEENFEFATMQQYIDAAEQSVPVHFGGKVPSIFVATDDCSVLQELRKLKPDWRFVRYAYLNETHMPQYLIEFSSTFSLFLLQYFHNSECDRAKQAENGFALAEMKGWSQDATDDHFNKFFVELYAMASAKVFIGIWYR